MKITAIKQQVKRAGRYSIFIDGEYSFSFSENELLANGLRIGQELDANQLARLKDAALIDKAYARALNLISFRMRSEWEMRDYLKRKEYEPEVRDIVVERLTARNYLNDQDFAKRWVESRRATKSVSKLRLSQELRQKRVADEIITAALEADETDELQLLKDLIERKSKRYPDKQKMMQFLARQGFSYDLIKQALAKQD